MINSVFCPDIHIGDLDSISGVDENGNTLDLNSESGFDILDVNKCPVGADDESSVGNELFARTGTKRYTVVILDSQIYSPSNVDADGNEVLTGSDVKTAAAEYGPDSPGSSGQFPQRHRLGRIHRCGYPCAQ